MASILKNQSRHISGYPSHGSLSIGAHSLPAEVLVQIFHLLFDMNRDDIPDEDLDFDAYFALALTGKDLPIAKLWHKVKDTDMENLSLFPYCVSYVCSTWNKICLGIPEFWTRIFIDIGTQASSILQLKQELKASHKHQISVHVSRRDGFTTTDSLEHRRMKAFMKILAPHISRCLTICIKTMHQLSLIPIPDYLSGNAPILETFHAYSHGHEIIPSQDQVIINDLHAPQVETIRMDTMLFQCITSSRWIASCFPGALSTLHIVDLGYSDSNCRIEFCLTDVFRVLNNIYDLQYLSLSGIRFNPEELTSLPNPPERLFSLAHLTLKDLQPHAAAAILRFFAEDPERMEALTITNCSIFDVDPRHAPQVDDLVLENEDVAEDLAPILLGSDPCYLTITDCPSFTSSTINRLSPCPGTADCICPMLSGLSISGENVSESISIASIKKLVASRFVAFEARVVEYPELLHDGCGLINSLVLKDFPKIDGADREWLQRNVRHVCIFDQMID